MSLKKIFESAINESPVGMVGRTGAADAKAHVGAELRAQFKKIVKQIGGKTVARQLLAEMNAGGPLDESDNKKLDDAYYDLLESANTLDDILDSDKKNHKDDIKKLDKITTLINSMDIQLDL